MEPVAPVPARDAGFVFLLALVALSAFAGVRDLWDADEGRYAAVARDMERSGDYVTPREAGMRFMDKPPLLYWMEVGAFRVLGHTAFAARLPCLVCGAVLAAIVFLLARAWTGDRRASWFAAGIAATSAAGMGFSRTVTTDMPLVAATTGALYAAMRALASPAFGWRVALGVGIGLALLAKGALGIVVPAVVAIGWAFAGVPVRRLLRVTFSPTAWVVALAIAAPWYAVVESRNPGYLAHFFLYEHVGRYTVKGHRDFVPFWLYVPVLLGMLLPWTPLLAGARLPRPLPVGAERAVAAHRLTWGWAVACLVFFSLGRSKLFTYILPAAPPLFVLAGARLSSSLERSGSAARAIAVTAFLVGALVGVAGLAIQIGWPFDWGWLSDRRLAAIGGAGAMAGIPLLLTPGAFLISRRPVPRGAFLFAATAALWWGLDLAAARVDELRSTRALADILIRESGPDVVIVTLDRYPQGLRWYHDVDARIAGQQREIVKPWSDLDGAGRLLDHAGLKALWKGEKRVVLVGREIDLRHEYPDGRFLAGPLAGAQRSDLWVVTNR